MRKTPLEGVMRIVFQRNVFLCFANRSIVVARPARNSQIRAEDVPFDGSGWPHGRIPFFERIESLTERREIVYNMRVSWKTRDTTRQAIKGCRNLLSRRRKGQEPKDLMQTYIDRRSPSQVKVGH